MKSCWRSKVFLNKIMIPILIEQSLIIQHWEFILPVFLVILGIFYFKNFNKTHITTNDTELKESKLDGEEYIGADYKDDEENDEYTPSLEESEHIPFQGASMTLPGGAEDFYMVVNDRRSIRSFSNKPIPIEVIETCIKAAGTSPSGAHTEPWTFCVISEPSIKAQIREIIEAEEYLNYSQRMHRQWTADLRPLRTDHIKEYLTVAPYLILIFKQIYGFKADGSRKQHYYNEISVSIATGILLCALQAAGLNSLVTTPLNCGPALRTLLNRPQNEKLLVLLPVGYASEDCKVPNLKRKALDDIMVRY
ncbi:iodotyrosine deiodinase [Eupeodes corollae]|uniref:iodotyrosine deiodinase n=1 Tax=Eupeodes corollae TaxID=290404 RepID=UPI002491F419|nr:iodotyrosine deiodinase [Eupeodes corollae]